MLPKIRYKRSTKKVDIEEIVRCIEEYCNSMISYLRSSNVSLLEHIMFDRIDFERTKDIATESLKDLKDGKMSMSECANKILKGDGKRDSNATGGIELISQSVTKGYQLLDRIQRNSLPKLKKTLENIEKVDQDSTECGESIDKIFNEFEGVFGELGEHTKTENLKESYELIENIEEMVPEAIKCMHKTAADPKYKLLREDLRYLANNKRKTHLSIITKAKKAVNQAVKSMISLAKLVNKQLPSSSSENKIKVKSPDQYTNKIKSTDGHWEVVLYLIEKKQQKMNKQIDDLRTELNQETLKKIKNSSEYKSFQKNLKAIKQMIMEKTTSKDSFQYF